MSDSRARCARRIFFFSFFLVHKNQDRQKLKQVRVGGETLDFKYMFGCKGHPRLLINMNHNKKTTAKKAVCFGKDAFGASCEVHAWDAVRTGEKFVPAETKTPKSATSTIEQEAKTVFGDSQGWAFLLGPADGQVTTYRYSPEAGLVLSKYENQPASDKSIDVGGDESNQVTTSDDSGSLSRSPDATWLPIRRRTLIYDSRLAGTSRLPPSCCEVYFFAEQRRSSAVRSSKANCISKASESVHTELQDV